ncbi:MAG: hypothetical protein RSC28_04045 [Bacteroidales bacterium]
MKRIYFILVCASIVFGTVSCSKDDPMPPTPTPEATVGAYILNSGKFNSNNSSLMYFDVIKKVVAPNVFLAKNGKKLGDTGQDMVIYGSKMYITVYNSGIIFVTDRQAKIIKEIQLPDYKQPRCVTSYGGKVYATYYDGALAQIDTTTFSVKTVKVGANPEELKVANGKVYVANSGGMGYPVGNTVSVVDAISLSIIKEIKVADNPVSVEVDSRGDIYLISNGNYGDVHPTFQIIDTKTDIARSVELSVNDEKGKKVVLPPIWMAMGANDKLFIVSGTNDESWLLQGKVYTFNTATKKLEGEFIKDGTVVKNLYCISADAISGDVYVGSSDYKNSGDMYIYGADGKFINKFETGINPIGVFFLTNK